MRVIICVPSRGLCHSRTIDDLLKNMLNCMGVEVQFVFSHGRPQPDAQNYLVEEALKHEPDYLWFIDDDMQLPETMLGDMLALEQPFVVAHYPVAKDQDALHIRNGKFESAGMGCVLITPEIIQKLEQPYFRCDTVYIWEAEHLQPYPANPDKLYHGLHDVDFFQRLLTLGYEPAIVETQAGQYNVVEANIRKYGNHTNQKVEVWHL